MKIIRIGTQNPIKSKALKDMVQLYPDIFGRSYSVFETIVSSNVGEQPIGQKNIHMGALNRAKAAKYFGGPDYHPKTDFGVGIESGVVKSTVSAGYINYCACVIYVGQLKYLIGQSSGFELPYAFNEHLNEGLDLDQISKLLGYTDKDNLGKIEGGLVGVLSKGKITRYTLTCQAIRAALVGLQNWADYH